MNTTLKLAVVTCALIGLPITANAEVSRQDVCRYADKTVTKATGWVTGAGVTGGLTLNALGILALEHSSGGTILYAAGAYLPHTLGVVGTAGAVLTAVPTLVVGGVATTVIGGTLLYCRYAKA